MMDLSNGYVRLRFFCMMKNILSLWVCFFSSSVSKGLWAL